MIVKFTLFLPMAKSQLFFREAYQMMLMRNVASSVVQKFSLSGRHGSSLFQLPTSSQIQLAGGAY